MALDTNLRGSTTGNGQEVDAANNAKVTLPQVTTPAGVDGTQYVGAARFFSENDPGTLAGAAYLKSPETSSDFRLRVGMDTVLFNDRFTATTQNVNNWQYVFATMTAAQPGAGTVNFGVVQGTTSAHGAFMRTFQQFPLVGTAPLAVEFTAGQFTAALVANEEWYMGLGLPSAAVTIPTDGVWFKLTSAGLIGVLAFSASSVETGVLVAFGDLNISELNKYVIVIGEREIEYWFDDQFLGHLDIPLASGQPFITSSLPIFLQKRNTGNVSNTNTMRVGYVTASLMDIATSKPWGHQMATMGKMGYQGQNGGTLTTTALLPNAAGATAVTGGAISQTVAIATGLGGQAGIVANTPGADGIITAYQVPLGGINQTPRNLIITGIRIDSVNIGAAVATTASVMQWSVGYGAWIPAGTLPPLTQADTASFATATTKSWKRVPLGLQSWIVGAAIGAPAEVMEIDLGDSPIVVHPGEWVSAIAKFIVGTATASQVIWCTVQFRSHYE